EEELRAEAEDLRRREQISSALAQFRRLDEERQFYAASSTPTGDRPLQYDPARSQSAGEKALILADQLAADLEQVELPDERAAFRKRLHDLLLLTVQAQCNQPP